MGMYTEIYICVRIVSWIPERELKVLQYLFQNKEESKELPEHKFFSLERWSSIGKSCSHYHIPYPTIDMKYNDIAKQYFIVSRSDLKNYDNEIKEFFNWINPFIDLEPGTFIGYSRYEECKEPQLYFK